MSTGYRLYQMTVAELEQFNRINSLIARGITAAVKEGAGTKSDEGSIIIRFPPMYDIGAPNSVEVQLTLYVFGPSRHYKWNGSTLKECLDQVERDINQWLTDDELLPTEDTCHVLVLDGVLCGFTKNEPTQWPVGHRWISLQSAVKAAGDGKNCVVSDEVSCYTCLGHVLESVIRSNHLTNEKLLRMKDVCHVLHHGRVLCGFTTDEPGKWPEGQHWVSLEDALTTAKDDVTCPECQKAVEGAHVKYDKN